jgi:hypothetical protein
MFYVRFVVVMRSHGRVVRMGLFTGLQRLRLGCSDVEAVREEFRWFNRNLPVPPAEAFEGGAGLSWFNTIDDTCSRMLGSAVLRIEDAGYRVWRIYSRNPGRVTYRDLYQIVAVPRWNSRGWPYDV